MPLKEVDINIERMKANYSDNNNKIKQIAISVCKSTFD